MLSKNLYFLRKSRDITQAQMPENVDVGRATWSNYENGMTEPDISTLIRISDFFNVSIDDLVKEDLEEKGKLNENEGEAENGQKGKGIRKPMGKLNQQSKAGYGFNETPVTVVTDTEPLVIKIEQQQQIIDALKQANSALLSLTEAQKEANTRLQQEIMELKHKSGPG